MSVVAYVSVEDRKQEYIVLRERLRGNVCVCVCVVISKNVF